jgi:hypothetical protein
MRASRGMGAINPSKMPGKKIIKRKDNPDDVAMYKCGGKIKRYDGTQGSQATLDDPLSNTIAEEELMQAQDAGSKKGGKVKIKRKK